MSSVIYDYNNIFIVENSVLRRIYIYDRRSFQETLMEFSESEWIELCTKAFENCPPPKDEMGQLEVILKYAFSKEC